MDIVTLIGKLLVWRTPVVSVAFCPFGVSPVPNLGLMGSSDYHHPAFDLSGALWLAIWDYWNVYEDIC